MVTVAQLRDLDVAAWSDTVDEWQARSRNLLTEARDLTVTVAEPMRAGAWGGPAGAVAVQRINELIARLTVDSVECKAISFVLNGLTEAFRITQDSLRATLGMAAELSFSVTDDGEVRLPNTPMARHDPDYNAWCQIQQRRLRTVIRQALDAATSADRRGHDALDRLSGRTSVTSVADALDQDLGEASRWEVDLIAGTVPAGSREEIAVWWGSLPPMDQRTLKLAAPWALENLDGIPADVRAELHGGDGYDRTRVAKWAIDNWNNPDGDVFDNNCTTFASDALEAAGVEEHSSFLLGTLDGDSWSKGLQTGWDLLDKIDYSHSATWAQAQESYEFWSDHGTEVGLIEARPGDVIYWEQDEDGYGNARGTVHHTAVVTSVIDGDIRYTQHSGHQLHASLDGRAAINEFTGGRQKIHIVRPDPDW